MQTNQSRKAKPLFEIGLPQAITSFDVEANRLREYYGGKRSYTGFYWPEFMPDRVVSVLAPYTITVAIALLLYFISGGYKSAYAWLVVFAALGLLCVIANLRSVRAGWYFENGCAFRRYYRAIDPSNQSLAGGEIFVKCRPALFVVGGNASWLELNQRVLDITSIESEPTKTVSGGHFTTYIPGTPQYPSYDVMIYFSNGRALSVASHLHDSMARIVTAQLNQALSEIRVVHLQ